MNRILLLRLLVGLKKFILSPRGIDLGFLSTSKLGAASFIEVLFLLHVVG